MDDYIKRSDALNALPGAWNCPIKCDTCVDHDACEIGLAYDTVLSVPAADVAEVVRCKDCKHWYDDADCGMACEFTNMSQPDDGFCNWGERRTEDG